MTGKDSARVEMWKIAIKDFAEFPLLGRGPSTFQYAFRKHRTEVSLKPYGQNIQDHAHNFLLNSLATTGLAGTMALAFLLGHIKISRSPAFAGLVALGVVALVNPLSFEQLCLAAVLAAYAGRGYVLNQAPRVFAMGLSLAGLYTGISFLRAEFSPAWMAAKVFPCETHYAMNYANSFEREYNKASPELKVNLMKEAFERAKKLENCRPKDAFALLTVGVLYDSLYQAGVEDAREKSRAVLLKAKALDPMATAVDEMLQKVAKK